MGSSASPARHGARLAERSDATGTAPTVSSRPSTHSSTATDAVSKAEKLIDLRERYRRVLTGTRSRATEVVDLLLKNPILTARYVAEQLQVSNQSGLNLLRQLEARDVLRPIQVGPGPALRWTAHEVLSTIFLEPDSQR